MLKHKLNLNLKIMQKNVENYCAHIQLQPICSILN